MKAKFKYFSQNFYIDSDLNQKAYAVISTNCYESLCLMFV